MSDLSWIKSLPEVGDPILLRLRMIEARELAIKAEAVLLRKERRELVRTVRQHWSDNDICLARELSRGGK